MAARQIRFCTDGWRAVIADDYTFENVRYCAQGWADYLRAHGLAELGCVVGYDTRSESEDFASAGAEVLAGNGIKALLCQRSEPTPVISFGIIYRKAAGGVTITASHNPTIYNGFNVRSECGGAIDTEVIAELEGRIAAAQALGASAVSRLPKDEGVRQGLIQLYDSATPYVEQIRELIDWQPIRDAGLKVVHDAMYGAGIGWFEGLLGGGKTQVIPMGSVRNPCFGGLAPEPIPRSLRPLFDAVRREGAMVGLATDGDSDRLGVCDEHGNIVDPLRVNSLLTLYVLEVRGFRGPIVKTLSTQVDARPPRPALRRPGRRDGGRVQVRRARDDGVGRADRRRGERRLRFPQPHPRARRHRRRAVHPRLYGENGEDATQLVEYLFEKAGPHYYDWLDIHFPARERDAVVARLRGSRPAKLAREDVAGKKVAGENVTDGHKLTLADGFRLLIRFSGTEPVIRIYAEPTRLDRVQQDSV